MRCSSSLVPSVAVTSACVSPRVNSAEPCVRGSTPTSMSILRISSNLRPSGRRRSFSISSRKMRSFKRSNSSLPSDLLLFGGSASIAFFLRGVDARVAFQLLVLLRVHRVLQFGADRCGDLLVQRLVDRRARCTRASSCRPCVTSSRDAGGDLLAAVVAEFDGGQRLPLRVACCAPDSTITMPVFGAGDDDVDLRGLRSLQ